MGGIEHISEERRYLEELETKPVGFMNEYEKECLKQARALKRIGELEDALYEEAHELLFQREDGNFKFKPTEILEMMGASSQEEE